jgi:hypothetical protein
MWAFWCARCDWVRPLDDLNGMHFDVLRVKILNEHESASPQCVHKLHLRLLPNYLFRRKDFGLSAYWPRNAELLGTDPLML